MTNPDHQRVALTELSTGNQANSQVYLLLLAIEVEVLCFRDWVTRWNLKADARSVQSSKKQDRCGKAKERIGELAA